MGVVGNHPRLAATGIIAVVFGGVAALLYGVTSVTGGTKVITKVPLEATPRQGAWCALWLCL